MLILGKLENNITNLYKISNIQNETISFLDTYICSDSRIIYVRMMKTKFRILVFFLWERKEMELKGERQKAQSVFVFYFFKKL